MIDIHAHAVAFLDAIREGGVTVYDGAVPDAAVAPYAVVYFGSGLQSSEALCDNYDEHAEFDVTVYSVGGTPREARWAASRVNAASGRELAIAGRTSKVRPVFMDELRRTSDDPRQLKFELRAGFTVVSLAV